MLHLLVKAHWLRNIALIKVEFFSAEFHYVDLLSKSVITIMLVMNSRQWQEHKIVQLWQTLSGVLIRLNFIRSTRGFDVLI